MVEWVRRSSLLVPVSPPIGEMRVVVLPQEPASINLKLCGFCRRLNEARQPGAPIH